MNRPNCDEFCSSYYRAPDPDGAPAVLAECIREGVFQNPDSVVWYFFVRIARGNPSLVRRYEGAFRETPEGRAVILKILRESGDEHTPTFLRSCLADEKFAPFHQEVEGVLRDWSPGTMQPLARPLASLADMDLHWCEFLATGNAEAVLRIIDVLARPDRIRSHLEEWLRSRSDRGLLFWDRARTRMIIRKLRKGAGIVCDLERGEVVTGHDLDCYCTMAMDPSRLLSISKLFPFSLAGDEHHLTLKAAAKWSLASNATKHAIVLNLCESEAPKRASHCRLTLLEIVAEANLAHQDIDDALEARDEAFTPEPPIYFRGGRWERRK